MTPIHELIIIIMSRNFRNIYLYFGAFGYSTTECNKSLYLYS